jgi:hypothetical protein
MNFNIKWYPWENWQYVLDKQLDPDGKVVDTTAKRVGKPKKYKSIRV